MTGSRLLSQLHEAVSRMTLNFFRKVIGAIVSTTVVASMHTLVQDFFKFCFGDSVIGVSSLQSNKYYYWPSMDGLPRTSLLLLKPLRYAKRMINMARRVGHPNICPVPGPP